MNPNFEKTFTVSYFFEKKQELKFVMENDNKNGNNDVIGECITSMGALMGAKDQTFRGDLVKG